MTQRSATGRRELNKQQTRDRLLVAARELIAEAGTLTTVEEIADRAEVSRATFFNYFPSKDDLMGALYARHLVDLEALVDRLLGEDLTTRERVEGLFADFVRSVESLPGYLFTFVTEMDRTATQEQSGERSRQFSDLVARLLAPGLAAGELRTDHSPQFLAEMVAAIHVSTLRIGWTSASLPEFAARFREAGRFAAGAVTVTQ